jgi:HEAT repeat protein
MLLKAGRSGEKAAPDLLGLADSADADLKARAIRAIDAVAPGGREAVQARLGALKDKDRAVRLEAAVALARMPAVDKDTLAGQVLPPLIEALKPETEDDLKDDGPWKQAVTALASAGKPAVEPLFAALSKTYAGRDNASGVARLRAVLAIKEIGPAANNTTNLFKLIDLEKSDPFLYQDPATGQTFYPVRVAARQARLALQAK